ncbi:MAG: hypothetical protein JJT77_12565 [Crocinitomicaceae bacterium]|nr:hypothetical protein [Crocinitomicaceae bacterium]
MINQIATFLTHFTFYITLTLTLIFSCGFSQENSAPDTLQKAYQSINEGTEFFIGASPMWTYRTLEVNEGLFAKPLGEKTNEEAQVVWSYFIGVRHEIQKRFLVNFGFGLSRNREFYSFETSDSLYEYTNTYRHISFPAQIGFTIGDELNFFITGGVAGKAFLSRRTDLRTREQGSLVRQEEIVTNQGFNLMLLDLIAATGIRFELDENYGIYFLLEAKRQLTNNFDHQAPHIRKAFGAGLHFGLHFYL